VPKGEPHKKLSRNAKLPWKRSGITLIELLIASTLTAMVALMAFQFLISINSFSNVAASRIPAESDLDLLMTSIYNDLSHSSAIFNATAWSMVNGNLVSGSYQNYPPVPLNGALAGGNTFAPQTNAIAANCPTELTAPCDNIIIFSDYPYENFGANGVTPVVGETATPQATAYFTQCVASNIALPYTTMPTIQPGLTSTAPAGGGLNCDPTLKQVPQVTVQRWTYYPLAALPNAVAPKYPVDTNQAVTLTNTAPNTSYNMPRVLGNGEIGLSVCFKFIRICNSPNPPFSMISHLYAEGAAIYRSTGSDFEVVRRTLDFSFDSRITGASGSSPPVLPNASCPTVGCSIGGTCPPYQKGCCVGGGC